MKKKTEEKPTQGPDLAKNKDLQARLAKIREKYGEDAISIGGVPEIEWIKTGLYPLDWMTGGGIPRSRFTHLFGPKSCGKTTLCHHIEAVVQQMGGLAAHVDAEHAMDPRWAQALGVDVSKLIYARPGSIEETEDTILELLGVVDFIAIDSVVAVAGEKELRGIEKDGIGKDSMMVIPQNLSKFFRVVTPRLGRSKTAVLLINQTRTNIGGYVAFDDFSGGNALRHANSVSLVIRSGPKDDHPKAEDGKTQIGQNAVLKCDKNKVGGQPAGTLTSFNLYFDAPHIRPVLELITAAMARDVIKRAGTKYAFGDVTLGIGREAAIKTVLESPELQAQLVQGLEA